MDIFIGMNANIVKAIINVLRPDLEVVVLPENSMYTTDYREDRIRLFHDKFGFISRKPRIG